MADIGIIFQPSSPPEQLIPVAQAAERAGVRELWVWEDCFKESGIAALLAAIGATERLRVGVGVLPMPLRNVALAAMEVATIERLHPGRARFGFGHGVQRWMAQTGTRVASPLTLMDEYISALRRLLAGEEVTVQGRYVTLDRVRLDWPPRTPVPVLAAGEGPKTISLTGTVADGTVMTGGSSPAMVRAAAQRIREAREAAGREGDHELVVFLMAAFGPGSRERMETEFDEWALQGERRFAATGDDAAVAEAIRAVVDAGATTVLLQAPSHDTDHDAFVAGTARVTERLASTPR